MNKTRLEAFSDAVIAIILTIMVLELKIPEGHHFSDLKPMLPLFIGYLVSFIYLGIYWNNHHHLLHTVKKVSGGILWANLHLMFWLSLIPFTTGWVGESHRATAAVVCYGAVLLMCAFAYWLLQTVIVRSHGEDSILKKAIGKDVKGKLSLLLYTIALPGSFANVWIGISIYFLIAIIWLVPDRRIENTLNHHD